MTLTPGMDSHLERLRIKAKKDIGEIDELIPEQIAKVRAIIAEDNTVLMPPKHFDHFLLRCLRARKYDVDRAAKTYKKICQLHHNLQDLVEFLVPTKYNALLKKHFICQLTSRDPLGRQILFIQLQNWNPYKHPLDEALATLFMVLDEALDSIDTQLNGLVVLVDFKGFGFAHARQAGPSRIQAVVSIIQDSYPARFKELHFYNHPTVFNMLFTVAKPFIKEKMRKRIFFHGHDLASVHKSFSPSILPESLGGTLTETEYLNEEAVARVLKKDDYYQEMKENFIITTNH